MRLILKGGAGICQDALKYDTEGPAAMRPILKGEAGIW